MNADYEISVIQDLIRSRTEIVYISQKQTMLLASLITQCLRNKKRDNRIRVLRYIVGDTVEQITSHPVESTRNLTSPIASALINLFIKEGTWEANDYAKELIGEIESRLAETVRA